MAAKHDRTYGPTKNPDASVSPEPPTVPLCIPVTPAWTKSAITQKRKSGDLTMGSVAHSIDQPSGPFTHMLTIAQPPPFRAGSPAPGNLAHSLTFRLGLTGLLACRGTACLCRGDPNRPISAGHRGHPWPDPEPPARTVPSMGPGAPYRLTTKRFVTCCSLSLSLSPRQHARNSGASWRVAPRPTTNTY